MTGARVDVWWDGRELSVRERPGARRLALDARCLHGEPVAGCWAHVCASTDPEAKIPYDDASVQQARRDAMAWWFPLLGERLVCLSTFSLDAVHCGGAVTVVRGEGPEGADGDGRADGGEPADGDEPATPSAGVRTALAADPFARLFAPTLVRVDVLCAVAPPAGPVVERYAGAPWPAGRFRPARAGGRSSASRPTR